MSEHPQTIETKPEGRASDNGQPLPDALPIVLTDSPVTSRRPVLRILTALALVATLVVGLLAGAHWHERIRGWFGHGGHDHGGSASSAAAATKQLWTCGMHPQVIQDKPGNCPICGMALEPLKSDATAGAAQASGERKIKYWWDPMMNPPYISDKPGKSPMGMDLVAVYEDEVSGGTAITIDPAVVQNMGVRVAQVGQGPIRRTVRAVGYLEQAQPRIHDVNLRVSGWVEKLHADTEGMLVKQGQPLFELYSPEVQVAVEELITARRAVEALPAEADETARKTADVLVGAARRKLEQWGLEQSQIEELAKLDKAPRTVAFLSPITAEVTEKMVVQGAMVKMGERALRLVDRSLLWLDAQVYAQDLPFIQLGQKATATLEAMPGRQFQGEIVFIHPQVDPMVRTVRVRMALANPDLSLRPGMFATATITAQLLDKALLVPREAILDTGTRQVVFVALERGHFEPRKLKTGPAGDDGSVQVLSGLAPGETVVTSGQFLMDAESRMKEAIQKHLNDKLLAKTPPAEHQGHGPSTPAPPADAHQGHETTNAPAQAGPIAGSPQWRSAVDATVAAYLKLSDVLGAVQKEDKPIDVAELCQAATALEQQAETDPQRALAQSILKSAQALVKQPLDRQREGFKPVSDAVVALVKASPPSHKVAPKLFVLYCSMAKGQWLQASETKANPYYATSMKQCAEVRETIGTVQQ